MVRTRSGRLICLAAVAALVVLWMTATAGAATHSMSVSVGSTTCGSSSSIVSNFNGTKIAAGSTIWFTAVFKLNGGAPSTDFTVRFGGQTITSSAFAINVPDAVVNFSASAAKATTTFDSGANTWVTTSPLPALSGNTFVSAFPYTVPADIVGGLNPVTWSGFWSTTAPAGLKVNWQWAAAVYTTSFGSDFNAIGVKPVDANNGSVYLNSDHAGTPETFKSSVVGGARGGGGSNFTGSYSGTGSSAPTQCAPPPPPTPVISFGYADNYFTHGSPTGLPWLGLSPAPLVIGCGVNPNGGGATTDACPPDPTGVSADSYDAAAILIANPSSTQSMPVTGGSVVVGACTYSPWPGLNITIPAGGSIVLTQTGGANPCAGIGGNVVGPYNFDLSESIPNGGDPTCTINDGLIPVVSLTINGTPITINDTGQILNTGGVDPGNCLQNEFHAFTQVSP